MRWPLFLLLLAPACSFRVNGLTLFDGAVNPSDGPPPAGDAGPDDLAGGGVDLQPDLMSTFTVSHVAQHFLTDGTCALTVASTIDTSALTVDGAAVPGGCAFTAAVEPGSLDVAVLAAGSLTLGTVRVTGSRPLVAVAGTTIVVNGTLDGSANLTSAGPGGAIAHAGAGAGANGSHANPYSDSGGSGAGFAVAGGSGGGGIYGTGTVNPTTGGASYGDLMLASSAPGGSGGGAASAEACTTTNGGGGGGGGSIQLTAGVSLTVSGAIHVGGGGGLGGCMSSAVDEGSGGGGGSGGAIFLESPMVMVTGGLWANGGSGGGGASGGQATGGNGNNGAMSQTAAVGGTSGGGYGGVGGAGGIAAAPTNGTGPANGVCNGGGGGGSAGRIVIRNHGTPTLNAANVSPMPFVDPSL